MTLVPLRRVGGGVGIGVGSGCVCMCVYVYAVFNCVMCVRLWACVCARDPFLIATLYRLHAPILCLLVGKHLWNAMAAVPPMMHSPSAPICLCNGGCNKFYIFFWGGGSNYVTENIMMSATQTQFNKHHKFKWSVSRGTTYSTGRYDVQPPL